MARDLTAGFLTELNSDRFHWEYLAHLDIKDNERWLWTGQGDLSWSGDTYKGLGEFAKVSAIGEPTDSRSSKVTLELSGIPSDLIADSLAQDKYRRRPVELYLAAFDSNGDLVTDPTQVFAGFMDRFEVMQGPETSIIQVHCEDETVDLNRPPERRYTHEAQQDLFPGDLFFDRISEGVNREIPWGPHANVNAPGGQGPPAWLDPIDDDY